MLPLAASVVALLVGPAVARLAGSRRAPLAALDGFIVAGLLGLVMLEILPEAFEHAGLGAVVAAIAGVALPRLLEGRLHVAEGQLHGAVTWGAIIGYSLHAVLDGAAMNGTAGSLALGVGVVLHRVPVGVTLWWLVRPRGARGASFAIALIGGATALGYFGAERLVAAMPLGTLGLFQALVGGSLLHVVAGHAHGDDGREPVPRWEAFGVGLGLLSLAAVSLLSAGSHAHWLEHLAEHALSAAPWAVVGAGLAYGLARAPFRWRAFAVVSRAIDPVSVAASMALLGVRFSVTRFLLALVAAVVARGLGAEDAALERPAHPVRSLEDAAGQWVMGAACAGLVEAACEGRSLAGMTLWPVVAVAAVALPLGGLAATIVAVVLAPILGAGAMVLAVLAPALDRGAAIGRSPRAALGVLLAVTCVVLLAVAAIGATVPAWLAAQPLSSSAARVPLGFAAVALAATLAARVWRVGPRAMVAGLVRSDEAPGHAHDHAHAAEHAHSHEHD